jgi:hypothetical protein
MHKRDYSNCKPHTYPQQKRLVFVMASIALSRPPSRMTRCGRALALALLVVASLAEERAPPSLPLQFSTDLEITAHLVDRTKDYPPWLRRITINYDYTQKQARAEILEGYEAGRTYVRRYDTVGSQHAVDTRRCWQQFPRGSFAPPCRKRSTCSSRASSPNASGPTSVR